MTTEISDSRPRQHRLRDLELVLVSAATYRAAKAWKAVAEARKAANTAMIVAILMVKWVVYGLLLNCVLIPLRLGLSLLTQKFRGKSMGVEERMAIIGKVQEG